MAVYERPFRPVELDESERRKFPVAALLEQLRGEETMAETGRASLTLVHGPGLTAVLTVARAGTVFDQHDAAGPMMLIVLSGDLAVEPSPDGGAIDLAPFDVFALGPDVPHVIEARSDATFLTIIGEQAEKTSA